MIHRFRDMPADLNRRKYIYGLIDKAHGTTGGDLGDFLMTVVRLWKSLMGAHLGEFEKMEERLFKIATEDKG